MALNFIYFTDFYMNKRWRIAQMFGWSDDQLCLHWSP